MSANSLLLYPQEASMRRHLQCMLWIMIAPAVMSAQPTFRPNIPKVWDEEALAEWSTPLAELNVRPRHISAKEYYSLPIDNTQTYPVYHPGREPRGYWEMLQHLPPKPLISPENLKSEADWVEAGRRIFHEADDLHLRT